MISYGFVELNEKYQIPKGLVSFFMKKQCPIGWEAEDNIRGRYIVGLNAPGKLGAIVGNKLNDEENRSSGKHNHDFIYKLTQHHSKIGDQDGKGSSGIHYEDGVTNHYGKVEGTNAPYVQLLACKKL